MERILSVHDHVDLVHHDFVVAHVTDTIVLKVNTLIAIANAVLVNVDVNLNNFEELLKAIRI